MALAIFDASFAQEAGLKSQCGMFRVLTDRQATNRLVIGNLVEVESSTILRVVRSTMAAEPAALSKRRTDLAGSRLEVGVESSRNLDHRRRELVRPPPEGTAWSQSNAQRSSLCSQRTWWNVSSSRSVGFRTAISLSTSSRNPWRPPAGCRASFGLVLSLVTYGAARAGGAASVDTPPRTTATCQGEERGSERHS